MTQPTYGKILGVEDFVQHPDKGELVTGGSSKRGAHRLQLIETCEAAWAFSYFHRIRLKKQKEHLVIGTLIHSMIAHHEASRMSKPPDWYFTGTAEDRAVEDARGYPQALHQARAAFEFWKTRNTADPWKPEYVETQFAVRVEDVDPLTPSDRKTMSPYELAASEELVTGRLDRIVTVNGSLLLVDIKSKAIRNYKQLTKWNSKGEYYLAWQPRVYLTIANQFFGKGNVRGFAIERIKQWEPFDHDRNMVDMPQSMLDSTPRQIRRAVAKELQVAERLRNGGEPNQDGATRDFCTGRYMCDYVPLCGSATPREAQMTASQLYVIQ